MVSEPIRRSVSRKAAPDLSSHCPVCGDPYQPGDRILTLACPSFAAEAVPLAATGRDPGDPIILGHRGCVLPRLLTLLAGFRPASRFALVSEACSVGEPGFPEQHHDEP
jgi:hypothetical protein